MKRLKQINVKIKKDTTMCVFACNGYVLSVFSLSKKTKESKYLEWYHKDGNRYIHLLFIGIGYNKFK